MATRAILAKILKRVFPGTRIELTTTLCGAQKWHPYLKFRTKQICPKALSISSVTFQHSLSELETDLTMNLSLLGKNALVGGSSKGIGKAVAIELALLGANVTLVSRSADRLSEALSELDTSQGQRHDFLVADFTDSADLRKKVSMLVTVKNIHILVNNTGGPPGGPVTEAQTEAFLEAFHNHLICNHLLTQTVLPGMKAEGYGRIVNIISTSVKIPIEGLGVSNTVRGAVANWSKTLANELGQFGITVNNVLPGATMTGRLEEIAEARATKAGTTKEAVYRQWVEEIPIGRIGKPHEVAAAVAFLASPAAGYVSGINLPVDGGRTKSL
jgi:3-oxoacyl-[acyl-carrier protein] reductase